VKLEYQTRKQMTLDPKSQPMQQQNAFGGANAAYNKPDKSSITVDGQSKQMQSSIVTTLRL
jgi:adenylylsulfate kinase-like enzyme